MKAPGAIDELIQLMEFVGIPGRKVADESGPEFVERGDALMREDDGFGCEAVSDGIEPDDQSAFRRHLSFGQTALRTFAACRLAETIIVLLKRN